MKISGNLLFACFLVSSIHFQVAGNYLEGSKLNEKLNAINFKKLELAIADLKEEFPDKYDTGDKYLKKLAKLKKQKQALLTGKADEKQISNYLTDFDAFRKEVLLSNPLLDFEKLLLVKRLAIKNIKSLDDRFRSYGFAANHLGTLDLNRNGWDNEISVLCPVKPDGKLKTLFKPKDTGYVGEIDLHWNADKLMFTVSDSESWKLFEMNIDGAILHQVMQSKSYLDRDDACYLPNGKVIFNASSMNQSVPCWHGKRYGEGNGVSNLFTASADGTSIRQVCFDQDNDWHPTVLNNGQVMYGRWDYTGMGHVFQRELMVMNPDGTGQRAIYGTNTWFPNTLYFPKAIPGNGSKIVCVISGYHDACKSGYLVVVDPSKGYRGLEPIVTRISGKGDTLKEVIADGSIKGNWPIFTTPFPLSEKYFLVSMLDSAEGEWTICLADIFDNVIELKREKGYHLLEPIPVIKQKTPPVIPEKVKLKEDEGTVYLQNVYYGPGLAGIPKGEVKKLRVFAYNYGFLGLAGPDIIGYGGPWEAMRILGTTPVKDDGSAFFKVPANTPIAVQPIDKEGKALQLMRSWFTVMPGEVRSCVGCHEDPRSVPPVTASFSAKTMPKTLDEWYGPARGFDFEREVQPVLNHYCVECHNGTNDSFPDLRDKTFFPEYKGKDLSELAIDRLHKDLIPIFNGKMKYTPAYDELIKYIRRVGIEDDIDMITPGPYYTNTSELVQMLRKGHYGVELNKEAWDRIYTWIDLNGPCHGTWGDVHEIPDQGDRKRRENMVIYANQKVNPEVVPKTPPIVFDNFKRTIVPEKNNFFLKDWPLTSNLATEKKKRSGNFEKTIKLANGIDLQLVKIPSGKFVMGDINGKEDERPLTSVEITNSFWMGKFEITNEIYNLFDQEHDSKYFAKRHDKADGGSDKGSVLNGPKQPVLNISWLEAQAFCEWLSKKTGMNFTLPSEAQWEYACRAGSSTSLNYGGVEDNFAAYANVGDLNFSLGMQRPEGRSKTPGLQVTGGVVHLAPDGAALADKRFDDNGRVTSVVGSYQPNPWGLYDMHGNVAEWTISSYMPYPYKEDGRNSNDPLLDKVVRGGSFYDRPERCRSAFRLFYPSWQKVFNVGFRIVSN